MNFVYINWSIRTSGRKSGAKEACIWMFRYYLSWNPKLLVFPEITNSLRAGREILKPVNQPQPATSPPWPVTCYCQITLHVQHCTALGLEQKPPATKRSFELLTVPQQPSFQKWHFPLSCTQQHSNWDTTAFGYPHRAAQQTWKKRQYDTNYEKTNDPADNCARLQVNNKSLNLNALNNPLQGIKIIRTVESPAPGSLLRSFRLSHTAWRQQERMNYNPPCFPFVFDIRVFYDFQGFTVMHKQNDVSRENSNTQYFWVITKPALPTWQEFLWLVCLPDYIKEVWSPTRVALLCLICSKFF